MLHLIPDVGEPDQSLTGEAGQPPAWKARLMERLRRVVTRRHLKIAAFVLGIPMSLLLLSGMILYSRYAHLIDARLSEGPFGDSVNIYAAPLVVSTGDAVTQAGLAAELDTAGFAAPGVPAQANGGSYRLFSDRVEILPADSKGTATAVFIANNQIARIRSNGQELKEINLGSPLITTMSANGGKERMNVDRLLVNFSGIPPVLVHAVVAAEDKHFFTHHGLDLPRIAKAAYVDVRDRRKEQGASTLTMQLVRGLWLDSHKVWMRKVAEAMMTIHLERTWSKEKIFETYVNQVYLGRQAGWSVRGFAAGARFFFGKELHDITLPEAALLAGLVQRPSYINPFQYPARARNRRNLVLAMMLDNGYIAPGEYKAAVGEPVHVVEQPADEVRAPYFLDLVNDELQARHTDEEPVRAVVSTIDLNLQRAADEAVASGMREVDQLLARRSGNSGQRAEAALIALDPHTGEIKAVVGGRDYGRSQFNRVLAKRPPGSVFKPFVYAAALNTVLSGAAVSYTPATTVDDTPGTFWFHGQPYQPGNFRGEVYGTLTLRQALAKSDNIAAVEVAQSIGYEQVVQMARRAGLNSGIKATPSVALGAYQVTPLEMAGAYTVFANGGLVVKPSVISNLRDRAGTVVADGGRESYRAMDPRVAWLMVSMLEEVMQTGTGAGVRGRGFLLPAAGKTGTSHDGWFAGFTSRLLCIVWVGFDDYRELNLEGAKSALPIWTEFMKRAARMGAYKDAREFRAPSGIEQALICTDSGKLAGAQCPNTRNEYFIAGSEPAKCDMHGAAAERSSETAGVDIVPASQ
jgi:penicillin-binding protein 1B